LQDDERCVYNLDGWSGQHIGKLFGFTFLVTYQQVELLKEFHLPEVPCLLLLALSLEVLVLLMIGVNGDLLPEQLVFLLIDQLNNKQTTPCHQLDKSTANH